MKEAISLFIQQKNLTKNSQLAYQYDLEQFLEVIGHHITASKLDVYQAFLQSLKPSAQKRKVSAVNQFLYFLYENGKLEQFYKLRLATQAKSQGGNVKGEDLSILLVETDYKDGQLIALLMAFLGLTPSEIAKIESKDVQLDFGVITVERDAVKRVMALPQAILPFLKHHLAGLYLFDKKGATYSRQWFFNRLKDYLQVIGHEDWTAQKLREQYILAQLSSGKNLQEIAKNLGLKTLNSLEKYKENGY